MSVKCINILEHSLALFTELNWMLTLWLTISLLGLLTSENSAYIQQRHEYKNNYYSFTLTRQNGIDWISINETVDK